jgi:hypothetical protein
MTVVFATNIIPGQSGTYRQFQPRVTKLLADSGLMPIVGPQTAEIARIENAVPHQVCYSKPA